MSAIAFSGAIEQGLVYAFVALGVFLTFRILDVPDLTVDGSFPLGAALAAAMIAGGWNPWLATALACIAGGMAGFATAFVSVRFQILHLLASILAMVALFSASLRILGGAHVSLLDAETVLTPFEGPGGVPTLAQPLVLLVAVAIGALLLGWFLRTDLGLAMRASGANPRMARAQGIRVGAHVMAGVALSNALVALAGALFAQTNGFADVTSGIGTIVIGLAAMMIGERLLPRGGMYVAVGACVLGAMLYEIVVQLLLGLRFLGLTASDLRLVTALLVLGALIGPRIRKGKAKE